jgi:hypothetical protein
VRLPLGFAHQFLQGCTLDPFEQPDNQGFLAIVVPCVGSWLAGG